MKNSPHRHKHQREKAIRKNSQVELDQNKEAPNPTPGFNSFRDLKDHLKPMNKKVNKEILNLYKKNLEHVRHQNSSHTHKRTGPGTVQGEGPYTIIPHNTKKTEKRWNQTNLAKNNKVARKVLNSQDHKHRKAA